MNKIGQLIFVVMFVALVSDCGATESPVVDRLVTKKQSQNFTDLRNQQKEKKDAIEQKISQLQIIKKELKASPTSDVEKILEIGKLRKEVAENIATLENQKSMIDMELIVIERRIRAEQQVERFQEAVAKEETFALTQKEFIETYKNFTEISSLQNAGYVNNEELTAAWKSLGQRFRIPEFPDQPVASLYWDSKEKRAKITQDWQSPETGMSLIWIEDLKLWAGKYEVTNQEYRKKNPDHDSGNFEGYSLDGDRQPVVMVTLQDAWDYADWLTDKERDRLPHGYAYRLPTSTEWRGLDMVPLEYRNNFRGYNGKSFYDLIQNSPKAFQPVGSYY